GLVENNRSKARLLEVIHQLTNKEQVFYFPAYELIIDDLRDYRFFKDDLVHPNDQAIKYIFGKFITALADQQTLVTFEKVKDIIKAKAHRALHDDSIAHQQFRKNYFNRCNLLQQEYPFLSLDEELHYFSA
ncbi:MAG TPA: GSCFA domain-containing protein, partial [Bacteroidia bacterium]|nr:GSCFA domain-containing protein [Bacteroidia bacterium]